MNYRLPFKHVDLPFPYQHRVLFFDPTDIYTRIKIEPHARYQSVANTGVKVMFPKLADRVCCCGCGKPLTGNRSRWATNDCSYFAADIYRIIYGDADTIRFYLKKYHGYKCKCGRVRKMKVDHIIPVKHGGGGCWLSNYQFLCHTCHVDKTSTDFGWKMANKQNKVKKEKAALKDSDVTNDKSWLNFVNEAQSYISNQKS